MIEKSALFERSESCNNRIKHLSDTLKLDIVDSFFRDRSKKWRCWNQLHAIQFSKQSLFSIHSTRSLGASVNPDRLLCCHVLTRHIKASPDALRKWCIARLGSSATSCTSVSSRGGTHRRAPGTAKFAAGCVCAADGLWPGPPKSRKPSWRSKLRFAKIRIPEFGKPSQLRYR